MRPTAACWAAVAWMEPFTGQQGRNCLPSAAPCTGEAKITKGYRLKAKYIIHTVGPIYSGTPEDAVRLADCYRNSLELAKTYDIHSIAFPAISAGAYGYPLDAATQIAVDTVADWLQSHADYDMKVIFCCFDARTKQAYQTKME